MLGALVAGAMIGNSISEAMQPAESSHWGSSSGVGKAAPTDQGVLTSVRPMFLVLTECVPEEYDSDDEEYYATSEAGRLCLELHTIKWIKDGPWKRLRESRKCRRRDVGALIELHGGESIYVEQRLDEILGVTENPETVSEGISNDQEEASVR